MITRRVFTTGMAALALAPVRLFGASGAPSRPREILLIRHAEEPAGGASVHLNTAGRGRADHLSQLFPARFATPDLLFAARSSKASHRSVETLTPLAAALHLRIDDSYDDAQYRKLAKAVLSRADCAGKHLLICWHHSTLPELASALGAGHAPSKWPDGQYDRVWQLRFTATGVVFADLPQGLASAGARPLQHRP
jgi:phosphohistidine phosphatase SixA